MFGVKRNVRSHVGFATVLSCTRPAVGKLSWLQVQSLGGLESHGNGCSHKGTEHRRRNKTI